MRLFLIYLISSIVLSVPASAQTVDETVTYLLFGRYADKFKQDGSASYDIPAGIFAKVAVSAQIKVTKVSDCLYHVNAVYSAPYRGGLTTSENDRKVDFNKLVSFVYEPHPIDPSLLYAKLVGSDKFLLETRKLDGKTLSNNEHLEVLPNINPGSEARFRSAFDHLRANYCKGRAF